MQSSHIETKKGIKVHVREAGSGEPLLFLHGAGGLFPENPFLEKLAEHYRVISPEWPGYGESTDEERIEDMLDFTLHAWDVADTLGLERPALMGHSMGGMIAAEMACIEPGRPSKLVLVCPAGLWIEEHPIPDLFSMLPHELPAVLAHDPMVAMKLLAAGGIPDFNDMEVLKQFLIVNSRQLGTAGKILFPIPNRRLSKRIYRLRVPTQILWGESDKLIVPAYADRWKELVPHAELVKIAEAGHLLPYEQEGEFVEAVARFLASP